MTLPTMKAGDRVRITVEGEVRQFGAGLYNLILDGGDGEDTNFYETELTAPTARVEVLPPPVDPDLVLAREVGAQWVSLSGREPEDFLSGEMDCGSIVRVALAAIKAARARMAVQG